jgi:glycerophosphoryl diester phosphodiesterase
MKKIVGFILLLLFFVLVVLPFLQRFFGTEYYHVSFKDVSSLQKYLAYSPHKSPLIAAHRGGPQAGFPENCMQTFQHSLKYAPCLIECDIRRSKDSILVLMHDEELNRTTTGRGHIQDFTFQQLEHLILLDPAGKISDNKIPSLDEALDWARERAILELDIKGNVGADEIIEILQKHDAFKFVVVITYTLEQLKVYADIHPDLVISASAHTVEGIQRILDTGIDPARLLIFVGVTEPNAEMYQMLHRLGIRSILGTMHNIDRAAEKRGMGVYLEALKKGADILATDNVPLVSKAVQSYSRENNLINPAEEQPQINSFPAGRIYCRSDGIFSLAEDRYGQIPWHRQPCCR